MQKKKINKKKKYLQFRKKFWFSPYKQLDVLIAFETVSELFLKLFFKLFISQRYVHNLERNWKNSDFIDVKNFANL